MSSKPDYKHNSPITQHRNRYKYVLNHLNLHAQGTYPHWREEISPWRPIRHPPTTARPPHLFFDPVLVLCHQISACAFMTTASCDHKRLQASGTRFLL